MSRKMPAKTKIRRKAMKAAATGNSLVMSAR